MNKSNHFIVATLICLSVICNLLLPLLGGAGVGFAQNVNIPDANFKAYLVGNSAINTSLDGEIQTSEASVFTGSIIVSSSSIADLTGIEAFTAITYLDCGDNSLTSLDISTNTALTSFTCWSNQLTNLDVSANTALTGMDCGSNQLTSLDVSANTALTGLACSNNSLTNLDVSANTALIQFYCNNNLLTSLNIKNGNNINFTTFIATINPGLTCVLVDDVAYMNTNWASAIDGGASYSDVMCCNVNVNIPDANFKAYLVGNSAINTNLDGEIQCSEATAFTGTININSLFVADLTGIEVFTALTILYCGNNSLTNLDISTNTALTELYCHNNPLTNLNVSANTALTNLTCNNNSLTSLDVSANTALTDLFCNDNFLTSLDVSANTALKGLGCINNSLTSLNIKNGNNINFTYFNTTTNPSLTCVLVDNAVYMNTNWASAIDASASYNDVCCSAIVDAGADQTVCGFASLNGSVSGSTTTGDWQTSGDGSFSPDNFTLCATYNFGPADIAFGTAVLTLTSTNNGACSAIQDNMMLTIDATSTFFGTVDYMGTYADSVNVVLYKINTDSSYQVYATVETDGAGYYQFTSVPEAKYVVKAEPSAIKYPDYLPTYFSFTSGTTQWDQAFIDSLYCGVNPLSHNISLIPKLPQTGGWQCNGYIYEYYGFGARLAGNIQGIMAPGEPIPDIDITIDQSPGGTVSSATTDVNGYFAFTGLNNNVTFVVRVDMPGYPNDSVYTFTVTPGDPALDSLNFYVGTDSVFIFPADMFIGVNLISLNEFNVNIAPNPTKSSFVLEVTSSKNAVLNISLTNSLGQVVLSNQSNLNIGLNKVNFDIQNQPSGVYFMSIIYENNHYIKKIIKQ